MPSINPAHSWPVQFFRPFPPTRSWTPGGIPGTGLTPALWSFLTGVSFDRGDTGERVGVEETPFPPPGTRPRLQPPDLGTRLLSRPTLGLSPIAMRQGQASSIELTVQLHCMVAIRPARVLHGTVLKGNLVTTHLSYSINLAKNDNGATHARQM